MATLATFTYHGPGGMVKRLGEIRTRLLAVEAQAAELRVVDVGGGCGGEARHAFGTHPCRRVVRLPDDWAPTAGQSGTDRSSRSALASRA